MRGDLLRQTLLSCSVTEDSLQSFKKKATKEPLLQSDRILNLLFIVFFRQFIFTWWTCRIGDLWPRNESHL